MCQGRMYAPLPVSIIIVIIELENLLQLEHSTSKEEGWVFKQKTDLYDVWSKTDPDHPVNLIKVGTTTLIIAPLQN